MFDTIKNLYKQLVSSPARLNSAQKADHDHNNNTPIHTGNAFNHAYQNDIHNDTSDDVDTSADEIIDLYNLPESQSNTIDDDELNDEHLAQIHIPTIPIINNCIPISCIESSFATSNYNIRGRVLRQYNVCDDNPSLKYELIDVQHPSNGIHTIQLHLYNKYAIEPYLININDYVTINQCCVQPAAHGSDTMEHQYILVLDNELDECSNTELRIQTQRQRLLNQDGTLLSASDIVQYESIPSDENVSVGSRNQSRTNKPAKGVKRKSSGMTYTPLGELKPHTQDNVYGIITRYSESKKSQGYDYHISLNIRDHTWNTSRYYNTEFDGLTINIFRSDQNSIPAIQRNYDIIRLHRLDITLYKQTKLQGISHKARSSHILISGRMGDSYAPYHSSSAGVPTDVDNEIIDTLRKYIATNIAYQHTRIADVSMNAHNPYARTIDELNKPQFCDLYVKVLFIKSDNRIMYVWDGTDAPLPLQYSTLLNRHETPDGLRIVPEYGTIVPVSYKTAASTDSLIHAVPGQWTHLVNVNVLLSDAGALYINYFKKSKCAPAPTTTLEVIDRLNKYTVKSEAARLLDAQSHNQNINYNNNYIVRHHSTPTVPAESIAPQAHQPILNNLKYFSELTPTAEQVDLVVKVYNVDSYKRCIFIWDGTDIQCELQYKTMSNDEMCSSGLRTPPYGTILSFTHSDPHAMSLNAAKPNNWILLRNINVKLNRDSNKVFIVYDGNSKCERLETSSKHVESRINNYGERVRLARLAEQQSKPQSTVMSSTDMALQAINAIATNQSINQNTIQPLSQYRSINAQTELNELLNESITTHSHMSQQITPIKSIKQSRAIHVANKYRVHARVLGITPKSTAEQVILYCRQCCVTTECSSEGNDICHSCEYNTDIEYQYSFKLILADSSDVLIVIVTGESARNLIQIEPCNLYLNENIRNTVQRQLNHLCDSVNWLDCCIFSYSAVDSLIKADGDDISDSQSIEEAMVSLRRDKETRKNYQMFDTMLKPFE